MKQGLNVLLSLMQLDIGGAETHVVELAKELKRRGLNPIVTSNGGAYERELEDAGIKHYCVPLQNKNPINMIKSVRLLRRIIKDENIDIVHSHARIPSFILGRLHKRMKFPFVTTAHWVFNTKWGLKYITEWGEKSVAVSEDIKKYLMDNYNIPESNIRVTINGIDTDKFSPDTDRSEVCREFNISDDDTVIVYVSRLDESRSLVAKQLINIADRADKLVDDLKIIVVGGGDDFENVKKAAEGVNRRLNRECVILTGPRTDINKIVATADLFVGVSRAALEAMAAQKPVIIAGNEGYIGLFDSSKLDVGIDTNFCCRGCGDSTDELLYNDIEKFFSLDKDKKEELAVYGRNLIMENYSVSRMAEDTMRVYDWTLQKNDEMLILGYYGFKNSGDDALLEAIIADIKRYKESPNITVLSANPKETMKKYHVNAINRFNVWKLNKHMNRAGMLIMGGGTLIQDATSTKSLLYYLGIIKLALAKNLRVMLYSNGVGPLKNKRNIKRAQKVLNDVDIITLRDPASAEILDSIGIDKPKKHVSADPVFAIEGFSKERGTEILKTLGIDTDKKIVGVSVRKTRDTSPAFEVSVAKVCDYISEKYGAYIVFVPMQPSKDEQISKNIRNRMKQNAFVITERLDARDMISLISASYAFIGMRLHSLIYAAIAGVPLMGIAYDPKIKSFMDYMSENIYIDINEFDAKGGMALVDELFADFDNIKAGLIKSYKTLKKKSVENGRIAVELYEKGSAGFEEQE